MRKLAAGLIAGLAIAGAAALAQETKDMHGQDATQQTAGQASAIFAGGCFWCMEPPYDKLDGVVSTTSA